VLSPPLPPRPLRLRLPTARLVGAFLAIASVAVAASPIPVWPAVASDLASDPTAHFGTLPNGVRYVILPNDTPRDRVSLRLLVAAGSLQERDYERGMAHFIEHMAFRGTRRHPGDALARELARLGIAFGPHSTGFTGYASTSYHLDLPDASEAMLRRGLDALRAYAAEVTFEPDQVERERGVVLGEKALRDTVASRLAAAQFQFLFPSAREVRRPPIGVDETIRSFTARQLIDFYDAWYRPERFALIVVGNVAPSAVEAAVADFFGPLRARAPARDQATDLITSTASAPAIRLWFDHGFGGAEFSLRHAAPDPSPPDDRLRRTREVHRVLAVAIMQRRLNNLARTAGGVFVAPTAKLVSPLPGWTTISLAAAGPVTTWKSSAAALEQEQRRALLHGFSPGEVAAVGAARLEIYAQAARAAATRPSGELAAALENSLLQGRVFATPAALLEDVAPIIAATTASDCTAAFRALWGSPPAHVFVAGPAGLDLRREEIAAVLEASRVLTVGRPANRPAVAFAYKDAGPPGAVLNQETVPDLDLHLATFANGVRLNFKTTAFEADSVLVRLRVGTGRISQPRDQPGLDLLAAHAFIGGGVRRHSVDQLRELLSGHAINLGFEVGADACVFTARCARAELPFCLRIITAYLTDAAYRPVSLRDAHADFGTMYARFAESPAGYINVRAERTLVPDDPRLGIPEINELFARSLAELSRWLEPQFKHGALELAIVGDIPWAEAVTAVGQTLAALPAREPRPTTTPDPVTFAPPAAEPYVIAAGTRLPQAAITWFWPVADQRDFRIARRTHLLAAAFAERLRLGLREELGVAYAPAASFIQHEGVPSFAYLSASAEVAADQALAAAAVIRREIESVRAQGFGADEFQRTRQPFLRKREDDLRTNGYWCFNVLDDVQQRPERLAAARDRTADSASITRDEINILAQRYLDPAAGFMFVAEPGVPHFWGRK